MLAVLFATVMAYHVQGEGHRDGRPAGRGVQVRPPLSPASGPAAVGGIVLLLNTGPRQAPVWSSKALETRSATSAFPSSWWLPRRPPALLRLLPPAWCVVSLARG
ncbi:hypothetical protein VPH35_015599 [Triticum aestivum]